MYSCKLHFKITLYLLVRSPKILVDLGRKSLLWAICLKNVSSDTVLGGRAGNNQDSKP